ncbi:MAG: hypothetical protein AAF585_23655 [Verrucomicrobiota bacterium]
MRALSIFWLSLLFQAVAQFEDGTFPVQSNLKAGVAKVDITPDDVNGMETIGHVRIVDGVRDPLRAGVLILDDGETKAAIVTTYLINAYGKMVELARARIEEKTGVPAANIMVTASHNHSGPKFDPITKYGRTLIDKLGEAASAAADDMQTVSIGG